ncbi:hypothetical protein EVAR_93812_1 [Eumeta japonica]|uniref:Uncharacterized protein n=1 Tax=Eumeta variegata TaxID=151549 RepID=A0A4C1VBW4_EUMVA|nr:hypothetical protein EVAR_93812_1 [Eumeta japonica]
MNVDTRASSRKEPTTHEAARLAHWRRTARWLAIQKRCTELQAHQQRTRWGQMAWPKKAHRTSSALTTDELGADGGQRRRTALQARQQRTLGQIAWSKEAHRTSGASATDALGQIAWSKEAHRTSGALITDALEADGEAKGGTPHFKRANNGRAGGIWHGQMRRTALQTRQQRTRWGQMVWPKETHRTSGSSATDAPRHMARPEESPRISGVSAMDTLGADCVAKGGTPHFKLVSRRPAEADGAAKVSVASSLKRIAPISLFYLRSSSLDLKPSALARSGCGLLKTIVTVAMATFETGGLRCYPKSGADGLNRLNLKNYRLIYPLPSFACVDIECISSYSILIDLVVNPNLVPTFNSGRSSVPDLDTDHTFDPNPNFTFYFNPGPVLNFGPGLDSQFPFLSCFQFRYYYHSRF